MKGFRKLFGLVLTLLLVGFPMGINKVNAGTDGTDITIHKIKMTSFTGFPKTNINAAQITNIQSYFGEGASELAGVLFNYYRVDGNSDYAAMTDASLASVDEDVLANAALDNASGVIKMDSFVTTSTGYPINKLPDGRYVFYEAADNGLVTGSCAVPFVLNLPAARTDGSGNVVYNADGTVEYLTSMHIYPKNMTQEPVPKKSVRVEGVTEDSAKVGDTVHYILTSSIPATIAEYDEFEFVDTLESTLDYAGNLTVKLKNGSLMTANTDYTAVEPATTGGGTLTVRFTQAGLTAIARANAQPYVEYDAKINESAKTVYDATNQNGDEITNSFDLKYINTYNENLTTGPEITKPSNEVYVYVGGKTFIKTNDYDRTEQLVQNLQGAKFDLCIGTNTPVTWTDELIEMNQARAANAAKFGGSVEAGQPIVLVSGSDGTFEIKGLKAKTIGFGGEYTLVETVAPAGYVKLNAPINFTVTKEGYNITTQQQIKNAKQPSIPQTGGIGTIIFLAVGLIMMSAAVVAMKRKALPKR